MCIRRILKDIKQLENLKVPLANIAVKPSNDNLLIWHGNIMGPEETYWEDMIFKFSISIPNEYPFKQPEINFEK